jgi:hypothetical protein
MVDETGGMKWSLFCSGSFPIRSRQGTSDNLLIGRSVMWKGIHEMRQRGTRVNSELPHQRLGLSHTTWVESAEL